MDTPQIIAGRFRIECEIGTGGMGTVYRATQLGLERPVAIKIIKPEYAFDPDVADRFMREARTMARLRHPHAAMIFDAGRLADGRPFIVMEYVEGHTLAETLAREGRFDPERAVAVASDILDVLDEAHRLGIVHRDLKPSNIMLGPAGVCVLDFGIAKVLATAADATRTHATTESGLVIGTPRYMSPEQCMGRKVGAASDLYSVGVMIYEMLAGRPPFTDQLSSAVLVKQATAPPPPLVGLRPELPRALAMFVHTLLAKNPAHRPASAEDARALLARTVAPPRDPERQTPPFASTIAALDVGTSAALRAASVFAVVLMLGAVLFAWSHSGRPSVEVAAAEQPAATEAPAPVAKGRGAKARAAGSNTSATAPPTAETREASVKPAPQPAAEAQLTQDAVQRIAQSVSRGSVGEARLVRTKSGQLIAAMRERGKQGVSHLYFMERRGGGFQVTADVALDTEGFRGADWATEVTDVDGDGFEEVVCTGASPRGGDARLRRVVLYAPRAREAYSLTVAPEGRTANSFREKWSRNSSPAAAKHYRAALRQRAYASAKTF
ncbi:MAG TPA: protein kinase [Pyrinomonadaceae bacterium]|nr:protein kinase [Pyrinomonadaceae bacterium]